MAVTSITGIDGPVSVIASSPLPYTGATAITAGSGNVAGAVATATMAATAGVTNYIAGFSVTGAGATAGIPVIVTVTGIMQATRSFIYTFATGATVANQPLCVMFDPPIPATAANVAIAVSCPAGTGSTHNAVNCWGFRL